MQVAARAAAMREATRLKNRQLLSVADSIHSTSQRTGTDRRGYGGAPSERRAGGDTRRGICYYQRHQQRTCKLDN